MECAGKGGRTRCLGPPKRLCSGCGAVSYCSVSHQLSHSRHHKEECERLEQQMRRLDDLNDFPFKFTPEATIQVFEKIETRCSVLRKLGVHMQGMWSCECNCRNWNSVSSFDPMRFDGSWNLPSKFCPCGAPAAPLGKKLTSWKDYYDWRCIPLDSPAALLLHWPLTVYHAIQLAVSRNLLRAYQDTLCIHYLGPERELMELGVFGELKTLFPGVKVQIEFFGPEIPSQRDGTAISLYGYGSCTDTHCSCKNFTNCAPNEVKMCGSLCMTFHFHKGLYHERFNDKVFVPHIVIGPNAGIAAYSSWTPTIELIKENNFCATFSDYCEEACHLAAGGMSSTAGISLALPIQLNPFRQPMAVEDSAFFLPCYSNCFLFGIKSSLSQ